MDKALENRVKQFMAEQLASGIALSEIQNMVNREFSLNMTYMDIRILASELDVDWQKLNPAKSAVAEDVTAVPVPEAAPAPGSEAAAADDVDEMPAEHPAEQPAIPDLSDTTIEVSKIARPGMMFSGTVIFANGATADWFLDNMGRLGVDNLQGDKPGEEDISKFQMALQLELRKLMGR